MEILPPTKSEMYHGYSPEKLKAMQESAIYDINKLVRGRKYALLSNGYYLGAYDSSEFISHIEVDCKCRFDVYKFTQISSNGKHLIITRSSESIKRNGVYEVTY